MAAQAIPAEDPVNVLGQPNEPPVEITALIKTALDGFNDKNSARYNSAFGGDVVIVDGLAPYRWTGPNAQGPWFASSFPRLSPSRLRASAAVDPDS